MFNELYNKIIINEDPDDLFTTDAIPFIYWDSERRMKSDFQVDDNKAWKEFLSKYKISFPCIAGLIHKHLYFNNYPTKLIAAGDYHDAIVELLANEEPYVMDYDKIKKDGHEMGDYSGRVNKANNADFISFWNEPVDDKVIDIMIKNTKKYIKWSKDVTYETAPQGHKDTRKGYGKGTMVDYKKGIKSFKAGQGEDNIDKVREHLFGANLYEGIGTGFKKVIIPNIIKTGDAGFYSGWYLPKEDTLIAFDFARHEDFMREYWPKFGLEGTKDAWKELPPDGIDSKLTPIVKKYSKDVLKNAKKDKRFSPMLSDFYELGWIRFNYDSGWAVVSHNNKGKKYVNRLLKYFVEEGLGFIKAEIDNVDGGREELDYREVEERLGMGRADNVADVRTRMFGQGIYEGKFDAMVEEIMGCKITTIPTTTITCDGYDLKVPGKMTLKELYDKLKA